MLAAAVALAAGASGCGFVLSPPPMDPYYQAHLRNPSKFVEKPADSAVRSASRVALAETLTDSMTTATVVRMDSGGRSYIVFFGVYSGSPDDQAPIVVPKSPIRPSR